MIRTVQLSPKDYEALRVLAAAAKRVPSVEIKRLVFQVKREGDKR